MLNTSLISIIVAALAVIVSAIMQYLTLKTTRRNTLTELRVGAMESAISELKSALAEHLTLISTLDADFKDYKYSNQPFTPEHWDLATKEDKLYNLIRLQLTPNNPFHQDLLEALDELRNVQSEVNWSKRRDEVIARATDAFSNDRKKVFGSD
jgi:hypothetical protein